MPEPPDKLDGSFGFDTLLCQLFRQIDPIAELDRQRAPDPDILKRFSSAAKRMSDLVVPRHFSEEQHQATREVLFHERVHYWQLISTSAMQRQIVNSLAHLQMAIELNGGRKLAVWSGGPIDPAGTVRDAKFLYQNLSWDGLEIEQTYEMLPLRADPSTTLSRIQYGMDLFTLMEGFVGDLGFSSPNESVARVPLVGRYLLECAAFVSEQLFKNEPIPRLTAPATAEHILYRGAWELWYRANSAAYQDPFSLALSFLAAVDLAVNPELPGEPLSDFRHITVPWRFGIILQAAPVLPPLNASDKAPEAAVAEFQEALCRVIGWPTPDKVALMFAAYLVWVYAPLFSLTEHQQEVFAFRQRHPRELTLEDLSPILEIIRKGGEPDIIGTRILRTAINAALHRLHNPGKFAVPHLHEEDLTARFPLPAILFDGEFYIEHPTKQESLFVAPVDYWSDCVRLMTIKDLRHTQPSERLNCGFVRSSADCPYTAAGAGCPKRGLSAIEAQARRENGLEPDWCHWKVSAMIIGLVPLDADKMPASSKQLANPPLWIYSGSPEGLQRVLEEVLKAWQQMSDEQRQDALEAATELYNNLMEEERTNSLNVLAIVDSLHRAGARPGDNIVFSVQ